MFSSLHYLRLSPQETPPPLLRNGFYSCVHVHFRGKLFTAPLFSNEIFRLSGVMSHYCSFDELDHLICSHFRISPKTMNLTDSRTGDQSVATPLLTQDNKTQKQCRPTSTPRVGFQRTIWAPGSHWLGGWVGPRAGLDTVEQRRISFLC
jgi:hypothetical protein